MEYFMPSSADTHVLLLLQWVLRLHIIWKPERHSVETRVQWLPVRIFLSKRLPISWCAHFLFFTIPLTYFSLITLKKNEHAFSSFFFWCNAPKCSQHNDKQVQRSGKQQISGSPVSWHSRSTKRTRLSVGTSLYLSIKPPSMVWHHEGRAKEAEGEEEEEEKE